METNIQNRNFTISTKISAHQKVLFNQEAKKHNISLSEWVCSTLDLSIDAYGDVMPAAQIRQLQEEISTKDKKIKNLSSHLETAKLYIDITRDRVSRQGNKILKLETTNQHLSQKMGNTILENPIETVNNDNKMTPSNNTLSTISGVALLLSIIVLGRN